MIYYFFALHKMKVFGEGRSKSSGRLENTKQAAHRVFSLPIVPLQRTEDAPYPIKSINDLYA